MTTTMFEDLVQRRIVEHFKRAGRAPTLAGLAASLDEPEDRILAAWDGLAARRLLVLGTGGMTIRMAAPFSGVPTPHVVESRGVDYWGNCAWDALGIVAALGAPAVVRSRCGHTGVRFEIALAPGISPSETRPDVRGWVFHSPVPVSEWWKDIGFT